MWGQLVSTAPNHQCKKWGKKKNGLTVLARPNDLLIRTLAWGKEQRHWPQTQNLKSGGTNSNPFQL